VPVPSSRAIADVPWPVALAAFTACRRPRKLAAVLAAFIAPGKLASCGYRQEIRSAFAQNVPIAASPRLTGSVSDSQELVGDLVLVRTQSVRDGKAAVTY
jgi:hypothetical protein